MIDKVVVLIPAYKPDNNLLNLVNQLQSKGFKNIVVVRDGGGDEFNALFDNIFNLTGHVLTHKQNLGKGRALKTGIEYIINNFSGIVGIVTTDADGQHLSEDIFNVTNDLISNPNKLVLGVRDFSGKIPLRSKLGNLITRFILSIMLGKKITDTQTGLRGIPIAYAAKLLNIKGEQYEFELNMLLNIKKSHLHIKETKIQTVYLNNNQSSHFSPLFDSIKIYLIMLRYAISASIAFIIDYIVFIIMFFIAQSLFWSFLFSRLSSLSINFYINKNFVFNSNNSNKVVLLKYILLVIINFVVVFYAVKALDSITTTNIVFIKLFIEIIMFFINFYVQRRFVFR